VTFVGPVKARKIALKLKHNLIQMGAN
jgi:hypothetical protein